MAFLDIRGARGRRIDLIEEAECSNPSGKSFPSSAPTTASIPAITRPTITGWDGSTSAVELQKLHDVLKQRFDLDDAQADELVAEATEAEQQAIDLYKFTARLNRTLDEAGRARVVEMMWQIVCADGVITEFEDNLIWRAADLLGISRTERIALRERVMAQRGGGGG